MLAVVVAGCGSKGGGRGGSLARGATAPPASSATTAPVRSGSVGPATTPPTTPAPAPVTSLAFVAAGVNVSALPLMDLAPGYLAAGGDPVTVPCRYESDSFTNRSPGTVPPLLKVVAWNVRIAYEHARVLLELRTNSALVGADFLLLTEVGRDYPTSVPSRVNQAREIAIALAMDYVFVPEFDKRFTPLGGGELGCAVLSKYPLGNVTTIRHSPTFDWYKKEQLLGGRVTLGVDALVGGKLLRLYASHLDTRDFGPGRARQAAEIRADANLAGRSPSQIVGGDLNTWVTNPLYTSLVEPAVSDFTNAGWGETLAGRLVFTHVGAGFYPNRLDWTFYRGVTFGAADVARNARGSDHYPLWFDFRMP